MHTTIDRRTFLAAAAATPALPVAGALASASASSFSAANHPVAISSGNGLRAVERAVERISAGEQPVDAVVAGVTIVEDDPADMSVGYGGLPNEDGVVELDSSVMDGPTHKAGAVAGIRNIRNPAQVALRVLRRTDHVLLVGEGAKRFALAHGFEAQDLLTEESRRAWLKWKRNLNANDDWLDDDQLMGRDPKQAMAERLGIPWSYGTIHCAAVDANGAVGACTTTSGLSYKIPGRVGDSPIVGAGMFVDNEVGAAGATGRGEAVIQSAGAARAVDLMARGTEPSEACLEVLRWIARHTKRPELLNGRGEPNFNVVMYALRRDGRFGSACMRGQRNFAVQDSSGARLMPCKRLFG